MTKDSRITVRIADSGLGAIEKIVAETETNKSQVVCEILAVGVTSKDVRATVIKRLKQRRGIE